MEILLRLILGIVAILAISFLFAAFDVLWDELHRRGIIK